MMAKKLRDKNLPAGAIVETGAMKRAVGCMLRNDGVELQPANKNRWYVMATIAGEQGTGEGYDKDLAAENRRYWNGWACAGLSDDKLAALAKQMGLTVADLKPLDANENAKISKRFEKAFGAGTKPPQPSDVVQFSNTYFKNTVIFKQYVISSPVNFGSAHFEDTADFSYAHFERSAYFSYTHFESYAYFGTAHFERFAYFSYTHFENYANFHSAHFKRNATFSSAHFEDTADFSSAHFESNATFRSAHFDSHATFSSAHFDRIADFRSARFLSTTHFEKVEFEKSVPEFHAAQLYEDTVFPASDKMEGHWPPVTGDGVMFAEDQKRAYNRLRLHMNQNLKVDEEMFFHRKEMACKTEIETGLMKLFCNYPAWVSA